MIISVQMTTGTVWMTTGTVLIVIFSMNKMTMRTVPTVIYNEKR